MDLEVALFKVVLYFVDGRLSLRQVSLIVSVSLFDFFSCLCTCLDEYRRV